MPAFSVDLEVGPVLVHGHQRHLGITPGSRGYADACRRRLMETPMHVAGVS